MGDQPCVGKLAVDAPQGKVDGISAFLALSGFAVMVM